MSPDIILNVMYYIIITPLLTVTLTKIAYSGEQEMVDVDAIERIDSIYRLQHPKEGDVVFTTEAPLGNVCRIPHFDTEFYIGQRIVLSMHRRRLQDSVLEV